MKPWSTNLPKPALMVMSRPINQFLLKGLKDLWLCPLGFPSNYVHANIRLLLVHLHRTLRDISEFGALKGRQKKGHLFSLTITTTTSTVVLVFYTRHIRFGRLYVRPSTTKTLSKICFTHSKTTSRRHNFWSKWIFSVKARSRLKE